MLNTDIVSWQANGTSSLQQDLYGIGNQKPVTDMMNMYNTTFSVNPDMSVWFTSYRSLDPNMGNETYVIPLNETINMIAAYRTNTSDLAYHWGNRFWWNMTITGYEYSNNGGGGGGNTSPTALIVIGSVGGGLLIIAVIVGLIMYMKKKGAAQADGEEPLNNTDNVE